MAGMSIADLPLELAYGAMDAIIMAQDAEAKICRSDPRGPLVSYPTLSLEEKGRQNTRAKLLRG